MYNSASLICGITTVIVIASGGHDIVHDRTEDLGSHGIQIVHGLLDHYLTGFLCIHDEQNPVPASSDHSRVRNQPYGRSIDQDIVELFSDTTKQLREALGAQKLCGVRWYMACISYLQPGQRLMPYLLQLTFPCQNIRYSMYIGHPKEFVHNGSTEVAVEYESTS